MSYGIFSASQVDALLERARKMLHIYKVLGASFLACTCLTILLVFDIFDGGSIFWPITGLLFTFLFAYHILKARRWMRKEYGLYLTEPGVIQKMQIINNARKRMEAEGKDFMSEIAP